MNHDEFNAIAAQMGHPDISRNKFRTVVAPLLADWDAKLDAETVASLVHMPGAKKLLDALCALVRRKHVLIRDFREANDEIRELRGELEDAGRGKAAARAKARHTGKRVRPVFPIHCEPAGWKPDGNGGFVPFYLPAPSPADLARA